MELLLLSFRSATLPACEVLPLQSTNIFLLFLSGGLSDNRRVLSSPLVRALLQPLPPGTLSTRASGWTLVNCFLQQRPTDPLQSGTLAKPNLKQKDGMKKKNFEYMVQIIEKGEWVWYNNNIIVDLLGMTQRIFIKAWSFFPCLC